MRIFYTLVWWLALPFVVLRLLWRSRAEPGYRQHMAERFTLYGAQSPGFAPSPASGKVVWIHAVSVGETHAAWPIVRRLLADDPQAQILLTHMTPTGRATGQMLIRQLSDAAAQERIRQVYLPYDTPWMARRFVASFRPRLGILMETEAWPNLVRVCHREGVRLVLANARLSARSLRRGQQFAGLIAEAAADIDLVIAQTGDDAGRLRQLGAHRVEIAGNTKFDVEVPGQALSLSRHWQSMSGERAVLLCASTRDGEEQLILDAWKTRQRSGRFGDALLVIVPRHPQRFSEVETLIAQQGLTGVRRSQWPENGAVSLDGVDVVLGDSMGEMFAYTGWADLAFIGGSLMPLGGQNPIEACAVGTPVCFGLHTFNFAAISNQAVEAGAAERVSDASELMRVAGHLLNHADELTAMSVRADQFALQHRGATARTMAFIAALSV